MNWRHCLPMTVDGNRPAAIWRKKVTPLETVGALRLGRVGE
jgi:hypothetical protein